MHFFLQVLKSKGVYTAEHQPGKAGISCELAENTYTTLQPTRLGRVSPGNSLALKLPVGGYIPGAFPWVPVTEPVCKGGYLKGDVEGLEVTRQVLQLNEVGRGHRLAVHKGGWRHDSARGNHDIHHPSPWSCRPRSPLS